MKRYGKQFIVVNLESERLFVHPASAELRLEGWSLRTDSRGLRGPERAFPKPAGARRLLFLGDSVTFGWGVDEEDTFAAMVERDLNAAGGVRWEAINAGHLFYDTTQERAVLTEVGLDYEPDHVFLVWVDNDVGLTRLQWNKPVQEAASPEVKRQLEQLHRGKAWLARIEPCLPHTHALLDYLYTEYRWLKYSTSDAASPDIVGELGVDLEYGWEQCQEAMRAMQALAAERGFTFDVLGTGRMPKLQEFCEAEGIRLSWISLTTEQLSSGVRNSASDPHLNRKGNRILADNVLRVLEELGYRD